jgi:2-polyprenyl-3-methyl-5-hydroxy-6-metoxy-1,4-benzoquinol methylase
VRRFVSNYRITMWLYARTPVAIRRFVAKYLLPTTDKRSVPTTDTQPACRVVRTLEQVDVIMREIDAAAAVSDDELRRVFKTFRMELAMPSRIDPASEEYRIKQLELYQWLHGSPYSVKNEASPFDVERAIAKPFPYSTESAETVGNQLIAIGYLIKHLALKPHSRVLEFGPGWGNTTIALARMGHQVTVIEIESNFVRLIKERANRNGVNVTVIQGDFFDCKTLNGQFDAVLFYESFHHCADHRALIPLLDSVIAPGGTIMFAAEPIVEEFPLPWGLRMDGESLWAIRRMGWMELGFKESYFRQLMDDNGWALRKEVAADTPWGTLFIASRKTS